jgi:hypothetical protein
MADIRIPAQVIGPGDEVFGINKHTQAVQEEDFPGSLPFKAQFLQLQIGTVFDPAIRETGITLGSSYEALGMSVGGPGLSSGSEYW